MHVAVIRKEGKDHFVTKDGRLSVDPKRAFASPDKQGLRAHLDDNLLNPDKFEFTYRPANDEEANVLATQIMAERGRDGEAVEDDIRKLAAAVLENSGWPILADHLRAKHQ
jgi:hypothetical protein